MKTPIITLMIAIAMAPLGFSDEINTNAAVTPRKKATPKKFVPSQVNYAGFAKMTKEVQAHRKSHMVTLDQFNRMAKEKGTIILDTRSAWAYKGLHMTGAIHLNFSDFTEGKLKKLIPNKNTRILIYCNNNFTDNPHHFPMKCRPLALNIPTYINLFGYGYKNVYELSESVSVKDPRVKLTKAKPPVSLKTLVPKTKNK